MPGHYNRRLPPHQDPPPVNDNNQQRVCGKQQLFLKGILHSQDTATAWGAYHNAVPIEPVLLEVSMSRLCRGPAQWTLINCFFCWIREETSHWIVFKSFFIFFSVLCPCWIMCALFQNMFPCMCGTNIEKINPKFYPIWHNEQCNL